MSRFCVCIITSNGIMLSAGRPCAAGEAGVTKVVSSAAGGCPVAMRSVSEARSPRSLLRLIAAPLSGLGACAAVCGRVLPKMPSYVELSMRKVCVGTCEARIRHGYRSTFDNDSGFVR